MVIHVGSGDGDDENMIWVVGSPWGATVGGGGGAKDATGGGGNAKDAGGGGAKGEAGGGGGAYGSWSKVRRFETARVRSRTVVDISAGERMGAALVAMAACARRADPSWLAAAAATRLGWPRWWGQRRWRGM
jgi:hypothetical protein